jgi:hypothetical protein
MPMRPRRRDVSRRPWPHVPFRNALPDRLDMEERDPSKEASRVDPGGEVKDWEIEYLQKWLELRNKDYLTRIRIRVFLTIVCVIVWVSGTVYGAVTQNLTITGWSQFVLAPLMYILFYFFREPRQPRRPW